MNKVRPRLFANDLGVWWEGEPGYPVGIEWDEVERISGYKFDDSISVSIGIELDHPNGHWVQLYDDWVGFEQVIDAITATLINTRPTWFEEIRGLTVDDPPLTVWQRIPRDTAT